MASRRKHGLGLSLAATSIFGALTLLTGQAMAQRATVPGTEHQGPHLTILGRLEVETHIHQGERFLRVDGVLRDETGNPVAGRVQLLGGSVQAWQACNATSQSTNQAVQQTDSGGRFCLQRERQGVQQELLSLQLLAPHHEPRRVNIPTTTSERNPPPRIMRAPEFVELEGRSTLAVEVLVGETPGATRQVGLWVKCSTLSRKLELKEAGREELVRFEFAAAAIPEPGPCQLVAAAGLRLPSSDAIPDSNQIKLSEGRHLLAQATAHLELQSVDTKRKRVELKLRATMPALPEQPIVPRGLVEARAAGAFLASAPLSEGVATLVIERTAIDREIELLLVPGVDGILAGQPAAVEVPALQPSLWSPGLKALGLVAFAAWLSYAWLGRGRRSQLQGDIEPTGIAEVVSRKAAAGPVRGQVIDTHTGEPVGDVLLTLVVIAANATTDVESCHANAKGRFVMETRSDSTPLLRVRVEAPDYTPLDARVTGSELVVQLSQRRRTLLAHLARWGRRGGWFRQAPPTPLQAAAAARSRGDNERAEWAGRIAEAAYGPRAPSEETAQELTDETLIDGRTSGSL